MTISTANTLGKFIVPTLSAGNFAIGMGAFVVIGILEPVTKTYAISSADAGWMMTSYAIAYAVGSPIGVALTGTLQRRTVLLAGMMIFAVASLLSAGADSLLTLCGYRVLAAFGAGIFTPVSAGVALSSGDPANQGRDLSRVLFGLTLSQVMGVPVGSFLGYTYGWPVAFLLVTTLSVICALLIYHLVPRKMPFQVNTLTTLGRSLLDWRSLLSVLFTASFLGAIYILFTYFAPLLETRMGYQRNGVTIVLLAFGIGAVIGNFLGGKLSDRFGPFETLCFLCVMQIIALFFLGFLPFSGFILVILVVLWSMFGWSFMVAQQSRLVRQTPERQNVVLSLNAASVYLGAAIGSAIGGALIDPFGLDSLAWFAGLFMLFALIHLVVSEKLFQRFAAA
ncbi:MAG: MFS transporter [Acidiferrobacterales bacterium]|nr:MFS transporter [Acidiferrobacterales bacterium]